METFWLQKRFPQAMERAKTSLSPALRKGGRGGHSAVGLLRATAPPQAPVPARRAGSCTSAPAPAPATHGQLSHPGPARAPTSVRLPHGRLTGSIFKRRRNLTPPTSPLYPGSTPLQSPSDPSWQESHSRAPQNIPSAAPRETPGTLSQDRRRPPPSLAETLASNHPAPIPPHTSGPQASTRQGGSRDFPHH